MWWINAGLFDSYINFSTSDSNGDNIPEIVYHLLVPTASTLLRA